MEEILKSMDIIDSLMKKKIRINDREIWLLNKYFNESVESFNLIKQNIPALEEKNIDIRYNI